MKHIKVLLVLLLSLLVLPGCVANQNGRDTYFKLKDDGYFVSRVNSNAPKEKKWDISLSLSKQDGQWFTALYLEDGNMYALTCSKYEDVSTEYCIYGGNEKCFDGDSKSTIEYYEKSKKENEKIYKKVLKKYNVTNEDILDMMDYLYSEYKGKNIRNGKEVED